MYKIETFWQGDKDLDLESFSKLIINDETLNHYFDIFLETKNLIETTPLTCYNQADKKWLKSIRSSARIDFIGSYNESKNQKNRELFLEEMIFYYFGFDRHYATIYKRENESLNYLINSIFFNIIENVIIVENQIDQFGLKEIEARALIEKMEFYDF